MDVKTFRLSRIEQVVEIAVACPVFWYRGQSGEYGNLTPKVFRGPFYDDPACYPEDHYVSHFQLEAKGIEANCPNRDDHLAWLFLMQHHGCPTRLLDWPESALVALYFAVTSDMDDDGELWCLHPAELNERAVGFYGDVDDDDAQIRLLAKDAVTGLREIDRRDVDAGTPPKYPAAITPSLWFRRGVNQLSRFTIHPKPKEGHAIEDTLSHPNLVRYLVPAGNKRGLRDALYFLGIRPNTLFPDLDGLSRGICFYAELLDRGAVRCHVKPPECDGEVVIENAE